MTTKLTDLKRKAESGKDAKTDKSQNVETLKRQSVKDEKQKVTLHLPLDVVEHLMLGKARKRGSMSDQVTELVRASIRETSE